MTLPIIWRASAGSDLAAIIRYVANVNPVAARRLRQLLMESVLPVSEHPTYIGRAKPYQPCVKSRRTRTTLFITG